MLLNNNYFTIVGPTASGKTSLAIEVAKKNIGAKCLQNIQYVHSNWFENIDNSVFDIIVSNPPYISKEDPHLKQPELTKQPLVKFSQKK